ncbi:MAG TPA: hypothetical protein VFC05_08725 [Nitrososphaeraceae archaeon]|nr:hypothetical protein [Nitrososphaeraceae archaeon]
MQFKCLFCLRTFSTKTAYGQHKKFCNPTDEELESILNVNDMSLDDEEFSRNIEEVRNL